MATIDFLLPTPLKGSGGHRTIVANAEALAARGHRVRLHVQESRRMRDVVGKTRAWYGVRRCETAEGWPSDLPDSQAIVATTWFCAQPVIDIRSAAARLYLVQDYDPLFHPAGDIAVAAAATYSLGMSTVVIGRWLQHKLLADHGVAAGSLPFTADPSVYRPTGQARERKVVAVYQPDKPRRCPDLVRETLRRVVRLGDVEVLTVGSSAAPSLGPGHRHLGILSVKELAEIYASSRVGLCISASNPSRIPFEMMASGLPVVEVHLPNTVYDLPENGCLLARPHPDSLATAVGMLLDDPVEHRRHSTGGVAFMADRAQFSEAQAFVDFVESQLTGHPIPRTSTEPIYRRAPIAAGAEQPWQPQAAVSRLHRLLPAARR